MAKGKKRPGERRRRKGKKRADPERPRFHRPVEWAKSELEGVVAWLERLQGPEGESYPEGWRRGQIKHYEKRARMVRAEIKASRAAGAAAKDKEDDGPNVA